MKIPSLILKQLYTFGSLENEGDGVRFTLKNRLSDAVLTKINEIRIDDEALPLGEVIFDLGSDGLVAPSEVTPDHPLEFPLAKVMTVLWNGAALEIGKHTLTIDFEANPFGRLSFKVKDSIREHKEERITVPYDKEDNYSDEIIRTRREFLESFSGAKPNHLYKESFEPSMTEGNIENFIGVAQIPIGLAGPVTVNGEYAKGDFIIPMATTEGTLVASYNRGMKVLNLSGGVTVTVSDDRMQRAPVFVFDSAREARDFRAWVSDNMDEIRRSAEATSSVAKLLDIDIFLANKFAYLRFNYSTGDAAGQNMVGQGDLRGVLVDARQHRHGALVLSRVQPGHRQETLADQHHEDPRQAGHRRGGDPAGRPGSAHAGRAEESRTITPRSPTSARSSPVRTTTVRIRRTGSPPCSSPRVRTLPMWPSPAPGSSTPN